MVGAQRVDGNEDDRRRSVRSLRQRPRSCQQHGWGQSQQSDQKEHSRGWQASGQAHIGMILDSRLRRKVEAWGLTARGEQGVGNAHGGNDCGGVVDAHDVCAAQDGGNYDGSVTRQEERGVRFGRGVAALRCIAMCPCNGPVTSPGMFLKDSALHRQRSPARRIFATRQ